MCKHTWTHKYHTGTHTYILWTTRTNIISNWNHSINRLYWDKKTEREWLGKQVWQRQKERKEETEAEREREGVYLQGRGGGTPKSAKSGSEERAEEGRGHSFLIHDYKIRILTEAKTTRCNNVRGNFLQRKIQIAALTPKLFWHPWMLLLLSHFSLAWKKAVGVSAVINIITRHAHKSKTCGQRSRAPECEVLRWKHRLEPPPMHDCCTVGSHLCTAHLQKSSYPVKIPLTSQTTAKKTIFKQ